jgi:hypothetical protein
LTGKFIAVQVAPAAHRSRWQEEFDKRAREQDKLFEPTAS